MRAPVWLPAATVVAYGLCPFAGFVQDNHSETSLGAVLPYGVAVVAPFAALVLIVQLWRGVGAALCVAAGFSSFLFLTLNFPALAKIADALPGKDGLEAEVVIWATVTIVVTPLAMRLVASGAPRATLFFRIGAFILLLPIAQYLGFRATTGDPSVLLRAGVAQASPPVTRMSQRPNVYYFMVDAYTRADVLRRKFGADNRPFIASLEKRGFTVPDRARSDYPVTGQSLPSTFAMQYLLGSPGPSRATLADLISVVQRRNPTVAAFRRAGYQYVQARAEAWVLAQCGSLEQVCLDVDHGGGPLNVSRIQWGLMKMSPAARLVEELAPGAIATGSVTPTRVVQALRRRKLGRPFFLFSHILMTHPPYSIRGKHCTDVTDAHVRDLRIAGEGFKGQYAQSVTCANRSLRKAVDQILADDPGAIIVIQGDHGSDVGLNWHTAQWTWPAADIRDRFAIFDALRLPPRCRSMVSDDTVVVNTFRIVLACIEGRKPQLLKPRFFITDYWRGEVRPYRDWER